MSLRRPFSEVVGIVLGKGDIQSIFCLVVFCIVFFVLAYLTNPSENSFRAYLTELSFRQHLSRLDDNIDDDSAVQEKAAARHLSFRASSADVRHTLPFDNRSPFHFANRASVSLRTPKHVFHSFGIFTIAAIIPVAKTDRTLQDQRDGTIADSWFIGAFGKWWRGGVLEAWYQDVIARSGDEESWSSGILGMKTLDRLNESNGLPFSTRHLPPHGLSRGSPPRLRNRDKSSQRTVVPPRSSTPPPLPKSASLPLHAPRTPQSPTSPQGPSHTLSSSPNLNEQITKATPTSPASFEQSPRVVELLQQISISKTTVVELRTQLNESQSAASQSHALLQGELDTFRERKRQEDAAKNDVKTRTKALEDSKRVAESTKRDAEKRLRVAENARDDAAHRIEHLDKEIVQLQNRLADDSAFLAHSQDNNSDAELALAAELEHKKREIKVAEDVVAALSLRTRELEEKLAEKRERARVMREHAEAQKQEQIFPPSSPVFDAWPSDLSLAHSRTTSGYTELSDSISNDDVPSDSRGEMFARPSKLNLDRITNFHEGSLLSNAMPASQVQGYFDPPMVGHGGRTLTFSPFADEPPVTPAVVLSPSTSSSLIPSSLFSSLDNVDGVSRSFQSDSDVILERDWREKNRQRQHPSQQSLHRSDDNVTSPTTVSPDREHDPFEVRIFAPHTHDRFILPKDSPLRRNNSDPPYPADPEPAVADKTHNRRWFSLSTRNKARKGLNPDAKVFDFTHSQSKPVAVSSVPLMTNMNTPVYDALNPNGLGHTRVATTVSDSNFLRAFAPSPAEREVLQRALGGSTNGSLERLPSLSDVGSIPPSPSHVHAATVAQPTPRFDPPQRDLMAIPSWLQSLPRVRKPNFSPWDDDESAPGPAVGNGPFISR
ncbi:hypothetical protein BDP27DRAFT_1419424 [Rhodocollybia butyracea]|uniref:Uncharacterized protein n=1 Tax=Rhodocollybia butyracea TaxID=206335 RepID=A0A9P5U9L6_9AGAR|nr:hypothetical protein BDP27DRAFT_1419424 [Rhodocollybia butyracea]